MCGFWGAAGICMSWQWKIAMSWLIENEQDNKTRRRWIAKSIEQYHVQLCWLCGTVLHHLQICARVMQEWEILSSSKSIKQCVLEKEEHHIGKMFKDHLWILIHGYTEVPLLKGTSILENKEHFLDISGNKTLEAGFWPGTKTPSGHVCWKIK